MATTHTRFDVSEYLDSEDTIAAYLEDCLEEGGVELFQKALGEVARAKGVADIAQATGLSRPGLYKALSEDGNPGFATIDKILHTFGLRLSVQPITHP
jgi:probable addiction module antidote protein